MKMAYADPPYLGQAKVFYGKLHERASDYDDIATHRKLIERLSDEFPDGWAMSLSSPTLRDILNLCPEDVRVMPWVKPFCSFKPGNGVAYAWEPVIVRGGRKRGRNQETVRDWVAANMTMQKGFPGAKPTELCYWLFQVLNLRPDDEFTDLFPGSGAVTKAWEQFKQSPQLRMNLIRNHEPGLESISPLFNQVKE